MVNNRSLPVVNNNDSNNNNIKEDIKLPNL